MRTRPGAHVGEVLVCVGVKETDEDHRHVVTAQASHLTVGRQAPHHQLLTDLSPTQRDTVSMSDNMVCRMSDNMVRGTSDNMVRGTSDNMVRGTTDNMVRGTSDNMVRGTSDNMVHRMGDNMVRESVTTW